MNPLQYICSACDKVFTTKYTLKTHVQKNKKCIIARGLPISSDYVCKCNHISMTKNEFQNHIQTCLTYQIETHQSKYEEKIEEKDRYYTEQIESHKSKYTEQIDTLKQTIAKLEAKLEKFEDAVISSKKPIDEEEDIDDEEIPIPLKEQMSSIVIDAKDDQKIEYSNITLNNVVISSRPIDHYVNATQLCKAGGKFFKDWFRLESTKELIDELSDDGRILPSLLVESNRGRTSKYTQGSWIHPDLSIQLAQWISPKFAIQVSKWIRTLFNDGSVQIDLALIRDKDRDMRIKDHRIKQLEAVCLSKQRRVEYPERNVIYMLTTDDHLRRRTYIIGKAKNLTQRLSTYNKTCDHTVIHYRECKNEEDMDTAETLVLNKLRDYREQANRDRFILPEGRDVSFFTDTIEQCVSFIG
jgi:hypothetical protein